MVNSVFRSRLQGARKHEDSSPLIGAGMDEQSYVVGFGSAPGKKAREGLASRHTSRGKSLRLSLPYPSTVLHYPLCR